MIRQSFQNIVNPQNIIENFQTEATDLDNASNSLGDPSNTSNYYQLISNMDSQCDIIIDDMDLANFSINDKNNCVVGGRTYAKSDKDYVTLRRENLNRIEEEYNKISNNNTLTDFERNSQLLCLMNKVFDNVKQVTENNDEMSSGNLENEHLARENDMLIEKNREIKKKDKDLGLVTNANLVGTEESKKQIQVQYLIFLVLIAIFLIIQLIIFFA
jgi:hypothetical protein